MRADSTRRVADLLIPLAMVLPTLGAWTYLVALEGSELARPVYLGSKLVQFSLPVAWWAAVRPHWTEAGLRPKGRGDVLVGLASGLALAAVLAAALALLAASPVASEAAARIRATLDDFRISTPAQYLALAAGLSVVHSLLEEVYWRAFVFRRLATWLPSRLAVALASAAFASHHLIVAARYAPAGRFWTLAVPATAGIAVAGAHWCDLYRRRGSLLAPWLSHLLVDAALMGMGYVLIWG